MLLTLRPVLSCTHYLGDVNSRLRGEVADKTEALLPYEFSVAIENIGESGYLTEKLLDCFLT